MKLRHSIEALHSSIRSWSFRLVLCTLLSSLAAPVCVAQSKAVYLAPTGKPVTMQDVIRLTKAGISDDVIIEDLKSHKESFLLSTDQIIQLKSAKVSDRVIAAMINPNAGTTQPGKPIASTRMAPLQKPPGNPAAVPAAQLSGGMPTQPGIYVKLKDDWITLSPEVVTWKSAGLAKTVASGGMMKDDVNGFVDGSSSKVRVKNPLEFVIVVPEGIDIKAYALVRLHDHEDYREFRTISGGVFHTRDVIPFDGVEVAPHVYHVTTSTALREYGILPPAALTSMNAASSAQIYSFGLAQSCGFTVPACE
jgi:hypothetical protein